MQPDGQLLGGRYALDELIASGGMGQVWRARDTVLNREVAVKVLRSEYTGDPTFRARFRAEAQLAAGLLHPNIATLFDYGEVVPTDPRGEHLAYLVMELVRGESLSGLLRRERRLSPERTLDILRQSSAGLAAAHAHGVVHRDVKPGNLLLGTDGTVKITDFGVATSAASVSLTQTGQVIGTPHYLSPEQTHGARATAASDVYALGVVGYECLAGRRVFEAESSVQVLLMQMRDTPDPLPADVPPPVRQLIEAALVKDPAVRYRDGAAFRDAIDDVIAGRPVRSGVPQAPTTAPSVPLSTAPMPAVAAPPLAATQFMPAVMADADDEPEEQDDDARRWRRLLVPLIALLAIAGVTVGGWQLMSRTSDDGGTAAAPSSSAPAATSTAPSSAPATPTVRLVDLTSSDYVGRPVGTVQAELTAKGLIVTLTAQQTGDVGDGLVTAVDPSGSLPPNSPVTVTYAVAPPPPTPTPTPTPAPTSAADTPAPETTPDEDDNDDDEDGDNGNGGGNGRGNGNGNGRGNG